jgi:hypothetical protein
MEDLKNVFGRMNRDGNVMVLGNEDGEAIRKLNANKYPVDSGLSCRCEHAQGIVLTIQDAEDLGIEIE